MGPATTSPTPLPTAIIAAMTPTPPATLSGGNSSRMMPNESGRTPPPTPWTARPRMSSGIELASAAINTPIASTARVMTRRRSFPIMSPTRPMMGVKIDAERRYAVTIHVTVFCVVCRLDWIVGSAGITSDCRSPNADAPRTSTMKVTR